MTRSGIWSRLFVLVFFFLPAVYGQVETARIIGVVKDSTGALVPGVQITIVHVQTNRRFSARTNDQGRYMSVALPVGEYRLECELPGFKKALRSGINLQVQDTAVVDFVLAVGEVSERIEVTADAPLLNAAEPSQGQVIDNRRIVDMPLNGRDYIQLALLSAGALEPIGGRAGGFSSGGQRTTQNNYLLDVSRQQQRGACNGGPEGGDGQTLHRRHSGIQGSDQQLFCGVRPRDGRRD